MNTPGEMIRALVVASAFAASACACKERSGAEPGGSHEHQKDAPVSAATASVTAADTVAAPAPALWEPIDKKFTGCEGG